MSAVVRTSAREEGETGPIARAVIAATNCQLLADEENMPAQFSAWWIYYCGALRAAEHHHEMHRLHEESVQTPRQHAVYVARRNAIARARERLAA